jgi:lysozyme family protein
MAQVELVRRLREQAARCAAAALFTYIWLQALLRDLRAALVATVATGPTGGYPLRSRAAAQSLVEWSLAAAVLAFVGLAAWQLAGTAITNAVNRAIGNLDRAGA